MSPKSGPPKEAPGAVKPGGAYEESTADCVFLFGCDEMETRLNFEDLTPTLVSLQLKMESRPHTKFISICCLPSSPSKHRRAVYYERLAAANRIHSPLPLPLRPPYRNNTTRSKSTSHLLFVPSPHPRYQLPSKRGIRLSIPSRQTQCLAPTGLIQSSSPRKQRPFRNASFATREQGTPTTGEKQRNHSPPAPFVIAPGPPSSPLPVYRIGSCCCFGVQWCLAGGPPPARPGAID